MDILRSTIFFIFCFWWANSSPLRSKSANSIFDSFLMKSATPLVQELGSNYIQDAPQFKKTSRPKPELINTNSPVYYIRLPPQPYMFVPGLGYVSQPTQHIPQFFNMPVNFVSNGKPSGIYQWSSGAPVQTIEPDYPEEPSEEESAIHKLPGKYQFNGKPQDIYVLRDSYDSLYNDALQSFYP